MTKVADNIKIVRQRISAAAERAGRDPENIKLLAVTKTATIDQIKEAIGNGIFDLGENKVQEAEKKIALLRDVPNIRWHMIGHLQMNKAKKAVECFQEIHSIDTPKLAEKVDAIARAKELIVPVFIEVNVSGEKAKYGVPAGEAGELAGYVRNLKSVELKGLMTMALYSDDPQSSRPYFKKLKEIADMLSLKELSMGMSGDFEVAIEEGATIIRVGTAIFNE
ncbi:MAG: YggS family pyridoxal phosphate-dependent enzyme [Candidatus Saganbacteria bacterium]|nr:YggS family pyridoxal phosphate-dependent enzyme [Candidatus Saganbacteria bacterium]